jgi:hypothetical protein
MVGGWYGACVASQQLVCRINNQIIRNGIATGNTNKKEKGRKQRSREREEGRGWELGDRREEMRSRQCEVKDTYGPWKREVGILKREGKHNKEIR